MRRSRIGRPRVSSSSPPRKAGAGARSAPFATIGMTFVGMGVYAGRSYSSARSAPAFGGGVGPLGPSAVTLLLEIPMLLGGLWIDLPLHGIGALLLLRLGSALTGARGRGCARRIGLRAALGGCPARRRRGGLC